MNKLQSLLFSVIMLFTMHLAFAQNEVAEKKDTTQSEGKKYSSLHDYFSKGTFTAHARTYFMSTLNEGRLKDDYALTAGAGIGYKSPALYGFGFGLSGFFIFDLVSSDLAKNDPYTNQPNRYEIGLLDVTHPENKKDLDRLEEAYFYYENKWLNAEVGRMILNTPFINPQDGRMRPSLEEGAWAKIKPYQKLTIEGGWLWAFSPRSTISWYPRLKSVGTYPVGLNIEGKKSGYSGNIDSKGVGIVAVKYAPKNFEIEVWNYTVQSVFNTFFAQAQYNLNISDKRRIKIGAQATIQDKLKNGGNDAPSKAYFESKGTNVGSLRVEYSDKHHTANINYSKFSKDGRFLMPREWGRDPFYTFIPRERNEGFGDVSAYSINYTFRPNTKGLSTGISAGIYRLPEVTDFKLNKYGLGDYAHINANLKYFFQKKLKGLDVQLLLMTKLNMDDKNLPEKNIYNRVNMFHTNIIINYYFNSREFKK
jgi:hypothetical protein